MDLPKRFAALLLMACALAGCNAQTSVGKFTLTIVNCQQFGVVSVTDTDLANQGTVCGTVSQTTADHICDSLEYGTAIDYGTAKEKGVAGGTGRIEATDLTCTTTGCTFNTNTARCTHSQDLVLQCSGQPSICLNFPIGGIIGIAIAAFVLCVLLPILACVACCVCACMGVACFASRTPNYSKL